MRVVLLALLATLLFAACGVDVTVERQFGDSGDEVFQLTVEQEAEDLAYFSDELLRNHLSNIELYEFEPMRNSRDRKLVFFSFTLDEITLSAQQRGFGQEKIFWEIVSPYTVEEFAVSRVDVDPDDESIGEEAECITEFIEGPVVDLAYCVVVIDLQDGSGVRILIRNIHGDLNDTDPRRVMIEDPEGALGAPFPVF